MSATPFFEESRSRGEIDHLIDGLSRKRLPTIDLAHADLAGSEQRPEQHGRGIRGWQHGLRLDSSLELLVPVLAVDAPGIGIGMDRQDLGMQVELGAVTFPCSSIAGSPATQTFIAGTPQNWSRLSLM
jgi:hypothetical protein